MYKDRKPLLWQKEVYALSTDYTIDLRKNDSLIRPYIGTLEIAKITYSQTFATREAAEACDTPNYKDDESRRYMLLLIRKVNGWLPGYRRGKGTRTLLLLYCKARQYPRGRVMLIDKLLYEKPGSKNERWLKSRQGDGGTVLWQYHRLF